MVFRYADREYVCVPPETADRWRELGLAKIISESEDKSEDQIKEKNLGYNAVENTKYPGAPPEPPKKTSSLNNSECREGNTLVFRFVHQDSFCTSPSTAKLWERLGLAKIIESEKELIIEEEILDEIPDKITEEIPEVMEDPSEKIQEIDDVSDDTVETIVSTHDPKIHEIADGMWAAVGYDSTNSILIEGDSGILVIDTLSSYDSAKTLLNDFRLISDKPIKTIIYTQGNSDLLLGSSAFVESGDGSVEIITSDDLMPSFSDSEFFDTIPTHTFSSTFSIDVSNIQVKLYYDEGEKSGQTYMIVSQHGGMLIADSVYGVAPYVLDLGYFQSLFEDDDS